MKECLCNHLEMELTSKIFTLLKEISILTQAPNNVEKTQYSSQTSQSIDTFSSDLSENFMGFDSCGKS